MPTLNEEARRAYQRVMRNNLSNLYGVDPDTGQSVDVGRLMPGQNIVAPPSLSERVWATAQSLGKGIQSFVMGEPESGMPNVDLGMTSLTKPFIETVRGTERATRAGRLINKVQDHIRKLNGYTYSPMFDPASSEGKGILRQMDKWRATQDRLYPIYMESETIKTPNPITFESSLKQTLSREGMPESYTPSMLRQLTNKLPGQGIKKEELRWLGWNQFVDQKAKEGKRISKSDLLKWVDDNTIDVVEHSSADTYEDFGTWMKAQVNPKYRLKIG